ncbi:MAG: epoxyqueuosine reductase QueH [Patescibacteria group bacterium]|mgnify:CR=1 FL=1
MTSGKKDNVLLHVCCAACASFVSLEMEKNNYHSVLFYFNPHFNHLEYHYRFQGLEKMSATKDLELIVPNYNQDEYFSIINPFQDKKSIKFISDEERLNRTKRELAMDLVLTKLAEKAKEFKIKVVTTSMLCSPYRDHNTIWDMGSKISKDHKLEFYYQDFRKGYWMGRNIARNSNLAIPSYCSDYLE